MNDKTYAERRAHLRKTAGAHGAILLMGNGPSPRNYVANAYRFRQDSSFLYYAGVDLPGLALLLEPDGTTTLFGPPEHPDDLIWSGPHPVLGDHARSAGVENTADIAALNDRLETLQAAGVPIRYLPPYRAERTLQLAQLLDRAPREIASGVCSELVAAVVAQRSIKTPEEVAEIENALGVAAEMYAVAMRTVAPGRTEAQIAGAMQGVALTHDRQQTFQPIVSVRGEVLHNETYRNTLSDGDLMVIDSGAESPLYYASDITRTLPVSGTYSQQQREIYEVVLAAQMTCIENASPRVTNRELHLLAAQTITEGLTELGLMRGDPAAAVRAGAHALFFPHGLGHMLGLDVHDMEDLGDAVGYAPGEQRSRQFGLSFLRLARRLEPGFVITIEPGIYFIPALIDRWKDRWLHEEFIDYDVVARYRGMGGVRIEDDILITDTGSRVLGPPIPKTVAEVEAAMAG